MHQRALGLNLPLNDCECEHMRCNKISLVEDFPTPWQFGNKVVSFFYRRCETKNLGWQVIYQIGGFDMASP